MTNISRGLNAIRVQMILIFSLLLSLTLSIVIAFLWYENYKQNLSRLRELTRAIVFDIRKAGNHERDFFIYETMNPRFYETGKSDYIDKYGKTMEQIHKNLENLQNSLPNKSEKTKQSLTGLNNHLYLNQMLFDSLIACSKIRGWKDYGYVGNMRDAIHAVEHAPYPYDRMKLLMIRRHEKDYLLRKQESYIEKLTKAVALLEEEIRNSSLNPKIKQEMISLLVNYYNTFDSVVAIDEIIGVKTGEGITHRFNTISSEIVTISSDIHDQIINEASKTSISIKRIFITILTISILLNLALIFFVNRKFGIPVMQLTESIKQVVQNNFAADCKIIQLKSDNELGTLSKVSSVMLDKVHERRNEVLRQKKKVEDTLNNLIVLSNIGKKITSRVKVEKIAEVVNEEIRKLLKCDMFAMGTNGITNRIEFIVFKGSTKSKEIKNYNPSDEIWADCFVKKEARLINNINAEAKKSSSEFVNNPMNQPFLSQIHIPLTHSNQKIGHLTLQSASENAYSEIHFNLMKNLAVYISIALRNGAAFKFIEKQKEEIKEQNMEITNQKEILVLQNEEIKKQQSILEQTNEKLESSINYARTIQRAILPPKEKISRKNECFIVYLPKDVVSGDFYWYYSHKYKGVKTRFIAVIDCTGHGVPGAFMSMIGIRLLNEIVTRQKVRNPEEILEELDRTIKAALRQDEGENNDGMDVCFCKIEENKTNDSNDVDNDKEEETAEKKFTITYCGAKRPLYIASKERNEIEQIKGSRRSIGGVIRRSKVVFENTVFTARQDDILYLSTDGIIDQASPERVRFGTPKLLSLLKSIYSLPLPEQETAIIKSLEDHRKDDEQRDDITFIGIKL